MISSLPGIRPSTTTRPSLVRLLSMIVLLCIPFRHVCAFQSMHKLYGARKYGSSIVSLLKLSSSTRSQESNSTSLKAGETKKSKHTIRWEKMFRLLTVYKEREGDTNVPPRHKEDGENLGRWLMYQRGLYGAGSLRAERQRKLESLGVEWNPLESQWEKMFRLLTIYKEREGDTNVPRGHKEEEENIGAWLTAQRGLHRKGELQAERQSKLESLGVELDPLESQWQMMVDLLTSYIEREGHATVPDQHMEDGENLGRWLHTVRQRRKKGQLQAERQSKLESLGVEWDGTSARAAMNEKRWERKFDLVCMYAEREGHLNIPYAHREEGELLAKWINRQRHNYRIGKLQVERQNKLESIGVDLNRRKTAGSPSRVQWEKNFDLLCAYREREGNAHVPGSHLEDGVKLGGWLGEQRRHYKDGTLLTERKVKLESLGVEWDGCIPKRVRFEMQWERMFDLLCIYEKREGNAHVPRDHIEDGVALGKWLSWQRVLYKEGTLLIERKVKLESLGVEWDGNVVEGKRLDLQWERMFDLLCLYEKREGNAHVPIDHIEEGVKLGQWLSTQRVLYNAGKLRTERKVKLESLGVEWDGCIPKRVRFEMQWERMFDLLCIYEKREGNAHVPFKHIEDGVALGKWLSWQRVLYNAGKLRGERQSKLESLGVKWKRR